MSRFFMIIVILLFTTLNATTPTKINVTRLYLATFERSPDIAGLNYWLQTTLSLEEIAMSFFDQDETKKKYPEGTTTKEFINAVYSHLFNRIPDSEGFDYWNKELDEKTILQSTFILAIINGALDNDKKILEDKTNKALVLVSSTPLVVEDIIKEEDTTDDTSSDFVDNTSSQNDVQTSSSTNTPTKEVITKETTVSTTPPTDYSKNRIDENFLAWCREYNEDTKIKPTIRDVNGTGFTWRATNSGLLFRMKNNTLLQKNTDNTSYLYTIFDSNGSNSATMSVDMSGLNAVVQLDGNLNLKFEYYAMIFDGDNWYISSDSFNGKFMPISSVSSWKKINETAEIISKLADSNSKKAPTLTFESNGVSPNFQTIKGIGLYYLLKDGNDKSSFRLNNIIIDGNFEKTLIYGKNFLQKRVSKMLFGLCITPNANKVSQEAFTNFFKDWVEYLRWPGGSMIEQYDLKNPSTSARNYFVGEWIQFVRDRIPKMEFIVGASASRGTQSDKNVTTYGGGLLDYLNINYNKSWGDNPALDKKIGLKYLEVGNEPFLEGLTSQEYGKSLVDYAKGVYSVDPSVKIMGPTNINGFIYNHLTDILKDYGEYLDIVNTHHYTDTPEIYKEDIRVVRGYMTKYLKDNDRRKVKDMSIAFTEYNSLNVYERGGIYHSVSWAKVIWHAETFSYMILGGVDIASVWHASMGGGHALYDSWGAYANPLHYAFKFWHNHIDFSKKPKVLYSKNRANHIVIVPIDMDDRVVIFVTNNSPTENIEDTINFKDIDLASVALVDTLKPKDTGTKWAGLDIASSINRDLLQEKNPSATIEGDKIIFPKIEVIVDSSQINISNNQITYTFPKYSLTAITIMK